MAISLKEFVAATNAEVVGGQLIVGERADRKFVGTADGTFTLNEDGQAIADQIEAGTYSGSTVEAEVEAEVVAEPTETAKPAAKK